MPGMFPKALMAFLRSGVTLFLSHPLVAFVLNIRGMLALYLTDLYAAALNNHALRFSVHIHFLLVGYVFAWSIVGLDPVPKRPSFKMKIAAVFLTIWAVQEAAKLMYYWGDLSELLLLIALFAFFYPRHRKTLSGVTGLASSGFKKIRIGTRYW